MAVFGMCVRFDLNYIIQNNQISVNFYILINVSFNTFMDD